MAVATCPKPEILTAFARGALDPTVLAVVAEHVGACAACCRALKSVPEDTLAGLARAAVAAPMETLDSGLTPPPPPAPAPASGPTGVPEALANHPRYRILGELGRGGMGTVYKAEDRWMARTIALKVVSAHLTAKASALARFRKEVMAAARLEHNNIVRAYDTGEADGSQFLVMEFVEGYSLDRFVMKKGRLSVPLACALTRQAALGLQHAADRGMVHRDIKPHNLLVTKKGQVKILDFGLARFARTEIENEEDLPPTMKIPFGGGKPPSNAGVTNPNLLMGTPDYLSPEQAKNATDVDPRSDIYSLGCTLYYLLTGRPPFSGASTLIDKLLAHTNDEPPSIRLERLEVTGELADVLAKMMAKKPENRYQTAAEVAAALLPFTRADAAKEPGFEIVEEKTPAPAPPVAPVPVRSGTAQRAAAADTAPPDTGPTLAEFVKPKKKKAKKRASWWSRQKGRVIGGTVALALLIAGAAVASNWKKIADKLNDPPGPSAKVDPAAADKGDKTAKGDKGEKVAPAGPPIAVTPPKGGPKVLYVLPPTGLYRGDYEPVRAQLEKLGAVVVTAAVSGDRATLHNDSPGEPVPINVHLSTVLAGRNLDEYSAVVFTGANIDEYIGNGSGSSAARDLIQKMRDAGKPVAAICVGEGVLAYHGALKGKRAAPSKHLFEKYPQGPGRNHELSGLLLGPRADIRWGDGGKWDKWDRWDRPGTVIDGKIITASSEQQATQFADAILKVIGWEKPSRE
jgi:eukaryotic-like serine/threonine-protein kinase